MMSNEKMKMAVKNLIESDTVDSIGELCAPDFVGHMPGMPEPVDRSGFMNFAAMLYSAFPDLHHDVEVQLAENDLMALCVKVSGTHQGEFQGIPATGKKVVFIDLIITRLENGKAKELWAQFDISGLLQQLGVQQV